MRPRLARAALFAALLLTAPPALADALLPKACDLLQALAPGILPPEATTFDLAQDRETDAMAMSLCLASDADGLPVASLLLRQGISGATPPPATDQRDSMIADLTETFGQAPDAQPLDIGEAALWVADIKQLMVWYRAGGVMLIVTAGGKDGADRAQAIARAIVAQVP